ncbi:MAG: DUF6442 family protein [bacterium]|nr:DUF6442 family protein [bacterium]
MLLRDEEKLRKARIANTDERNIAIQRKAMQTAFFIMLVAMYLVMLIGGIWYPVLAQTISLLLCVFLVVYLIAYGIISKKM